MENNELLNIIIKKEEQWLEITSNNKGHNYSYTENHNNSNDEIIKTIVYKDEIISIFSNSMYNFGYSIFKNIIIIWDQDYDISLFTCANIFINKSQRFHIHSLYKNKDELFIVFKEDVPSLYTNGKLFKVNNKNLIIKEVLSLEGGIYFLYPNYGTFQERIKNGYNYTSSLENPFIQKIFK
jgi:hypothetical protein